MDYDDIEDDIETQLRVIAEVQAECDRDDPVVRNIIYHHFVSKSKGQRNGKKRIRRHWKEVHLVKYRDKGFQLWNRFPFDEIVSELLGQHVRDEEVLKQSIINRWGF